MIIFRFSIFLAIAALAWPSIGHSAEWSAKTDDVAEHQVHWLMFGEAETEAEIAFYCQRSTGWVYVLQDRSAEHILDPAILTAGTISVMPSYRVRFSEMFGNHSMTAILDSEHELWRQVIATGVVAVDGSVYRFATQQERIALVEFLRRCSGTESDE